VKTIAADTSNPVVGPTGEVVAPTVRDIYVRFQTLFDGESAFVIDAASNADLTQTQADEALGVGGRLIELLDNPPAS
jgi:hypothetical protein